MYFKDFPKFLYDFKYGTTDDVKMSVVTDITRNIRFRKEVLENYSLYDEYDIKDGETPEIIAEKVYGNPNYHWIIMLANQRYDYISDFPLDQHALDQHIKDKYNPTLTSSNWYINNSDPKDIKIYFKVDNPSEGAFNPAYINTSVLFNVKGMTTVGEFSLSDNFGDPDHTDHVGFDFLTQYFWLKVEHDGVIPIGDPVGSLTINTSGREYNAVYFLDANGFKVDPTTPGAYAVSGAQEADRANEEKRRIKLISPDVISLILKQYKEFI